MIYLDANATTPMLPEVVDAMLPWLRENYANPSSSYRTAKLARNAIDDARAKVAELIDAAPEEIVFTGSGTESVNTALFSLDSLTEDGNAVVSAIEHSAVLKFFEGGKRRVTVAAVDSNGQLDTTKFPSALGNGSFVSVMMANNETGVVQPISRLLELSKSNSLPFHTDAIQAIGKISVSVKDVPVDLLSMSGHKFHGPKGIGALYVRKGLEFTPMLRGGGQQNGRRSGTENTAAIVAMGRAAEMAKEHLKGGLETELSAIRDAFEEKVMRGISGCLRNGAPESRLPNTCHLSFDGCDSAGLLILLDEMDVACSAGSACMTGKSRPSHVQLAMGISESRAKTSLRFSFSKMNDMDQGLEAASRVIKAVQKLRSVQSAGTGPVAIYSS
ncbi:MAG: cysteine desulfurase family protein [Akkermansiaceae bacterium]